MPPPPLNPARLFKPSTLQLVLVTDCTNEQWQLSHEIKMTPLNSQIPLHVTCIQRFKHNFHTFLVYAKPVNVMHYKTAEFIIS